jgi:hypothetical protein
MLIYLPHEIEAVGRAGDLFATRWLDYIANTRRTVGGETSDRR